VYLLLLGGAILAGAGGLLLKVASDPLGMLESETALVLMLPLVIATLIGFASVCGGGAKIGARQIEKSWDPHARKHQQAKEG
jgi:hypothetical protein